jgi:DHA1 family bicyclomycin/chloramphenicol resistance-like MFS transporter
MMNLKPHRAVPLSNVILTLILGSLQTIMPLSTDLYLPALPTIARDLNVSPGAAQFTLAVFLIGVAIGQVAYGPITDKYGRKTPLLLGLAVYMLGSLVCAIAPTINILIGGRFLQALGASASAVITPSIARDLWSGKTLADRLSLLFLVVGAAPLLAPSLGGLLLTQWNWHALFWCLVLFGLLVTLAVTRLSETSSPHERAGARLRDAASTYASLLRNPPFLLYVLTGACLAGCLLAFITGASFIYIEGFGVNPTEFAVLFSLTATGFVAATQINRLLLRHLSLNAITRGAVIVLLLLALLLLAVVASGGANKYLFTALLFVLSGAIGCAFPNLAALAFGTVQERMGSAAALQGTLQSVFGGVAGALVSVLANGATLPVIAIMSGFALFALIFLFAAQRRQ